MPDLPRLVRRAQQMLELNKERAVQSTTGDLRERERMWVYRRDKRAVPTLRHARSRVRRWLGPGGPERAAYWCPSCQPVPGAQ